MNYSELLERSGIVVVGDGNASLSGIGINNSCLVATADKSAVFEYSPTGLSENNPLFRETSDGGDSVWKPCGSEILLMDIFSYNSPLYSSQTLDLDSNNHLSVNLPDGWDSLPSTGRNIYVAVVAIKKSALLRQIEPEHANNLFIVDNFDGEYIQENVTANIENGVFSLDIDGSTFNLPDEANAQVSQFYFSVVFMIWYPEQPPHAVKLYTEDDEVVEGDMLYKDGTIVHVNIDHTLGADIDYSKCGLAGFVI